MSQSSRQLIKKDYTTNRVLEAEARRLGIPLWFCWNKDAFTQPIRDGLYIVNLANSGQPGTHWTALWKENNRYCWFDSFGFPPPEEVEQFLPRGYLYNATVIQDVSKGFCGGYCIEFGEWMNGHRSMPVQRRFQSFLNVWNENFAKNARILKKLQQN